MRFGAYDERYADLSMSKNGQRKRRSSVAWQRGHEADVPEAG